MQQSSDVQTFLPLMLNPRSHLQFQETVLLTFHFMPLHLLGFSGLSGNRDANSWSRASHPLRCLGRPPASAGTETAPLSLSFVGSPVSTSPESPFLAPLGVEGDGKTRGRSPHSSGNQSPTSTVYPNHVLANPHILCICLCVCLCHRC